MPRACSCSPGVGAQGGRVEDLAPAFAPGRAGGLVTASRSIVGAHERRRGGDPARAARAEAERLRAAAWALGLTASARARPVAAAILARRMRRRAAGAAPLRWLAPLALVVAGVAVYSVVARPTTRARAVTPRPPSDDAHRPGDAAPGEARQAARAALHRSRPATRCRRSPTKTGVSLATIEQLNPELDPQALQAGQTIKLGP